MLVDCGYPRRMPTQDFVQLRWGQMFGVDSLGRDTSVRIEEDVALMTELFEVSVPVFTEVLLMMNDPLRSHLQQRCILPPVRLDPVGAVGGHSING
jgi:hypothetical protein